MDTSPRLTPAGTVDLLNNPGLGQYQTELADLGSQALREGNADQVIAGILGLLREELESDYCALYESAAGPERFIMRGGFGWRHALRTV